MVAVDVQLAKSLLLVAHLAERNYETRVLHQQKRNETLWKLVHLQPGYSFHENRLECISLFHASGVRSDTLCITCKGKCRHDLQPTRSKCNLPYVKILLIKIHRGDSPPLFELLFEVTVQTNCNDSLALVVNPERTSLLRESSRLTCPEDGGKNEHPPNHGQHRKQRKEENLKHVTLPIRRLLILLSPKWACGGVRIFNNYTTFYI